MSHLYNNKIIQQHMLCTVCLPRALLLASFNIPYWLLIPQDPPTIAVKLRLKFSENRYFITSNFSKLIFFKIAFNILK